MDIEDTWAWPQLPTSEAEFEEMMASLDDYLAGRGRLPAQRSLEASRLVSIALKLSGTPMLGGPPERGPEFGPRDILARVFDWYEQTYGQRNKLDLKMGYVVFPLGNTYWRLRIPLAYGELKCFVDRNLANVGRALGTTSDPASHNVLTGIDGLTQKRSDRLTEAELDTVMRTFANGHAAMATLHELDGDDLFDQARADYASGIEALAGGQALSNARWDTAQCAEKVFKGLLARARKPYPTGGPAGPRHRTSGRTDLKPLRHRSAGWRAQDDPLFAETPIRRNERRLERSVDVTRRPDQRADPLAPCRSTASSRESRNKQGLESTAAGPQKDRPAPYSQRNGQNVLSNPPFN